MSARRVAVWKEREPVAEGGSIRFREILRVPSVAVLQEILDMLFHSPRLLHDPEVLPHYIARWKRAIRAEGLVWSPEWEAALFQGATAASEGADTAWIGEARAMRAQGKSFDVIAKHFKRSATTVRRHLSPAATPSVHA